MAPESSDQEEDNGTEKQNKSRFSRLSRISRYFQEEQILPKNSLGIVSFALMCTMFLAALGQTIVATALPTIVVDLKGGSSYNWVGSAYALVAGACIPLYGKLSNMFGRKPLLYWCISIFLVGSALCGASQSMIMLILCRALQGIGGGGIMPLSMIVISEIVPLKDRGRYGGLLGATYGIASVCGPLLGGALSEKASWRWCFFINLPTGGVAMALMFFFLNVNPPEKRPLRDQIAELDYIGLLCLVSGVVFLILGLSLGEEGWSKPQAVVPIVLGLALLIGGGVNETYTKRVAIIPPRLLKTRTPACLLAIAFLNGSMFFPLLYYLPLFYQVLGSSALLAGIKMLPYSLVSSAFSILSGFIISHMGKNRPAIWFGATLLTAGTGLMIMLDSTSNLAEQELFPTVAAIGMGFLFQIPMVALQAAMPPKDLATATSAYMFLRMIGGAVGIAVGGTLIAITLPKKLEAITGGDLGSLGLGNNIAELNQHLGKVASIPDLKLRSEVLHAWTRSLATIWMVVTASAGVTLILTLFLREYPVKRRSAYTGKGSVKSQVEIAVNVEVEKDADGTEDVNEYEDVLDISPAYSIS